VSLQCWWCSHYELTTSHYRERRCNLGFTTHDGDCPWYNTKMREYNRICGNCDWYEDFSGCYDPKYYGGCLFDEEISGGGYLTFFDDTCPDHEWVSEED